MIALDDFVQNHILKHTQVHSISRMIKFLDLILKHCRTINPREVNEVIEVV